MGLLLIAGGSDTDADAAFAGCCSTVFRFHGGLVP